MQSDLLVCPSFRIDQRLSIACVNDDWKSVMMNKKPHVFVDELAAIESESKTFLKDLTDLFESFSKDDPRKLWLSVDVLQSLDSFLCGFSDVSNKTCISTAKRTPLILVHRCTANVFEVNQNFLLKMSQGVLKNWTFGLQRY